MTEEFKEIVNHDASQVIEISQNPQRTPVVKIFASFMAGAVIVGSLMFTSDKLNLFSGGASSQLSSSGSTVTSGTTANGGVQTASVSNSGTNSMAEIAKQASPAVVKIETKAKTTTRQSSGLQTSGIGSGFIFDASGYILTNEHVINGADEIDVYVQGYNTPFKATLLGSSYGLDLAVLKIVNDKPFSALPIGNSDNSQVGDWVVAIGNPYDFDYSVTAGVLSAKERSISIDDPQGVKNYQHLIQTDTAINPGNSGGPLLNLNGEVIGINTAINANAQGMGFAVPAATIISVLDKLKNNQTVGNG